MVYVSGYEFDLFVSYAHCDNAAIPPADQGWVDVLDDVLRKGLMQKLGRECSIWRDRQHLRGNQEISSHISDRVRNSANFLAVLSPCYLASEYCLKELKVFLDNVKPNATERLFVVWIDPLDDPHEEPKEFHDLLKYKFWNRDQNEVPQVLCWPLPRPDVIEDRLYYSNINSLARDIANKLRQLNGSANIGTPRSPVEIRQRTLTNRILLAQVTDDLDERREEMLRYLELAGVGTLPAGVYRPIREEFEQGFLADLEKCKAFVQLLGPLPGKTPPDAPEGYARLQLSLAKSKGVPILQWRSPDLNVKDVSSQAHQQLLQADTVVATSFEEFERTVVEVATKKELPRPERPPFIFVSAAPEDRNQARSLKQLLKDSFDYCEQPDYGKAEEIQSAVESFLIESDAIVVFYGNVGSSWVDGQLSQFRKLAHKRPKEPRLLAVVNGTKEAEPPIHVNLRGMMTFPLDEAATRIKAALTI